LPQPRTVAPIFETKYEGGGCGPRPAALQQRGDEPAFGRDRRLCGAGSACRAAADQAGRYVSDKLRVPPNITLLPLPPKCPELTPVENLWQFLRDNWLSNRVFPSYRAILDHCCHAWNKLVAQPWTIMSIGFRDWAHGTNQWDLVLISNAIANTRYYVASATKLVRNTVARLPHKEAVM
jgi:transposase